MKKYLLLLVIPFTLFAETCEELKSQAISNITSSESLLSDNARYIQITYNNITALGYTLDTLDQRTSGDPYVNTARSQVSAIREGVQLVEQNENTISNDLFTARSLLASIDCSCDETATCPCDFSDIIQLLTSISSATSDIYIELQSHGVYLSQIDNSISQIEESITQITTILDTGFFNTTNILSSIQGVVTNLFKQPGNYGTTNPDKITYIMRGDTLNTTSRDWWSNLRYSRAFFPLNYGYLTSLYSLQFDNFLQLSSINNYFYDFSFRRFPILTNTVGAIHRDTTNFFSFFRGEIGVQGVLSDWQSEQVSGTYHDFLTNHYLTVVRGGSLSGNQSSKTNWFSRIETLLAALVFTDSAETNTVDISAGNAERQQLASSYGTANQAAANFSEDFKNTSQSIVTLYQNYFTTFENAAMPSHVVLMRLSNSDSSEEIEISFQSDSLGVLVEACRVITTFCWASVGIFLLYKFLVWSARCVIVACQFIYRAISSVFKS